MFEKLNTPQVASLLRQNLEQEEHILQEVKQATQELAQQQFAHAA